VSSGATQLFEADGQQSSTTTVGKEAEVAYTNKASRQQVQQEATEELVCVQAHQLPLVAVCGIAPTEVDVVIAQCNESVVGDCDTMGIGAEIAQDVLGASPLCQHQ
jgi:hypothetical protein